MKFRRKAYIGYEIIHLFFILFTFFCVTCVCYFTGARNDKSDEFILLLLTYVQYLGAEQDNKTANAKSKKDHFLDYWRYLPDQADGIFV